MSTILDSAIGRLEAAQDARSLRNVVVAHQLVVCNAVQGAIACSWTSRHALASGTIDGASVLLQRLVGETARAVRCLASLDDVAGSIADALYIGDGGRGDGDEAKENGGDRELHLGELWCLGYD